jgi:hypothetical protein
MDEQTNYEPLPDPRKKPGTRAAPMTRPVKAKLATLDQLDGRTIAAKQAREVISSIEADLGGRESISTARRALIENAAVLGAVVQNMGAKWMSGEQIDLALFATLSNTRRRLLESVGLDRAARDVTPSVSEYPAQKTPTEKNK